MKSNKQHNRDLCAEPRPEDGIPPQVLARRARKRSPGSVRAGRHRLEQLCKQVRIALDEALVIDCGDPVIQNLEVISVVPLTGSSVLLVTLRSHGFDREAMEHAQGKLESVSGLLRAAVAAAVHRKRVPQLRFCVVV